MRARDAAKRFIDWYRGNVLPFWERRAYDETRGGFFEALHHDGTPAPGERRVRVQARQIHTFAEAHALGWVEGEALARRGFEYFLRHCCPDDGARGCVHRIGETGEARDDARDLYDQAFLILACASMIKVFGEARARTLADKALAFLDRELQGPVGGYLEDDQGTRPRRQNPHMHFFEALIALHRATGETAYLTRADAIFELFETRLFNAETGAVIEFFNDDFTPHAEKGAIVEPGHVIQWVFQTHAYGEARAHDNSALEAMLFESALRLGADQRSGFLVDRVTPGEPAPDLSRRLWPQTEYLRACYVFARRGEAEAMERAAMLTDALFETYFRHDVKGLWHDRFDGEGRAIAKDVPASILYHLLSAAREAQRFLDET